MEAFRVPSTSTERVTLRLRVLLVDDNSEFLKAATRFLHMDPRIEVVGCVTSSALAVEQCAGFAPDVVLIDLNMPGVNGFEATQRLKLLEKPPYVILVSMMDTSEHRLAAEAVHVDGFIAKSDFGTEIMPLLYQLRNL